MPFKELGHVIRWALSRPEPEAYFALEECLKRHRPDFITLLENPVQCCVCVCVCVVKVVCVCVCGRQMMKEYEMIPR